MPLSEQVQELNIDMGNMKSYFHKFDNIIIYIWEMENNTDFDNRNFDGRG